MRWMTLGLLLLICAACSRKWTKPNGTASEFAQVKWQCRLNAKALNDNQTWSKGFTEGMMFKECMQDHGWSQE